MSKSKNKNKKGKKIQLILTSQGIPQHYFQDNDNVQVTCKEMGQQLSKSVQLLWHSWVLWMYNFSQADSFTHL